VILWRTRRTPEGHAPPRGHGGVRLAPPAAALAVDRTALWVLLAVCSAAGIAHFVRTELRLVWRERHDGSRTAPIELAGRVVVALLTGLGYGMAGATLILFGAALIARI
jgi:hypothetical protein